LAFHQPRLLRTATALAEAIKALSALCASVRVLTLPAERSIVHRWMAGARSVAGSDPFDVHWLQSKAMKAAVTSAGDDGTAIDLTHVDTVGLWPYVAGWTRSPVVLDHHNIESALLLRRAAHDRLPWRATLMRRDAAKLLQLERRAAGRAAVNLVVSTLDATRLHGIVSPAAVEVVENGVDTEYWRPFEGPTHGLVFAGTLGWYPNRDAVEFLLSEVWPALSARRPERRLVLVGRDPPPAARAAAADPRIEVTGFVTDARPYIGAAAIYVCPIRIGGGTRLKVLDAFAMAKPLVATATAVEGLDIVEGVHYLRAETASEFVAQIERLEQYPELRASLGVAGRNLVVGRYEWRLLARQLDVAYMRAIDAGGRTSRVALGPRR
jgi:glycosyltransferase involved in cell wall biosynthesis